MDQSLRTRMVRDRAIYQGVRGVVGTRYSDTTSTYVLGRVGGTSVCCNGTSVPTPPNAPLIADTDVSDGSVIIYIADRAITAYAYSVNDPSGAITDVSYSSPIIITGLTNGTAYTFYVRAKNEAGYSEPTSTGPLTPVGPPSAPVISSPISGNNQLSVPFTTPANGGSSITGYKYALNGGSYSPLGLVTSPAIITGLTNGTTYTVNLKATNAIGDSAASNTASGTPAGPPSAPTINGVSSTGTNAIITFMAGSDQGSPITNYQYSTNGGSTYNFFSPAQTTSPLTVTGLAYNTTYSIRIKAVNSIGPGAASIAFSLTTPGPPVTVPNPPTELLGVGGNQAIYVLFTAGANGGSAITNYEYSVDGGNTFTAFSPPQTTSPVEISGIGLTNGANYQVLLKAVNAVGASVASDSTTVTPTTNTLNATNRLINLDASNTSSYSGSGTTWTNLDSAGSYSATLRNAPTFDNANKWFTFNGTNQIADISASTVINPTAGSSFTAQIWARVDTASPNFTSGDGLISKQFGFSSYDGYSLTLNADTRVFLNMNGATVNGNYGSSTGAFGNGWALYTIVVRFGGGATNPSYTYVSTRRVVTANNLESFMPSQAPLQFPRGMQDSGSNYCPADVGAFYLYNTALSQEDIIRNYDATKTRYGL